MNDSISGPLVRAARQAAKLSQNTIAQALRMNRMYYSLFEAGRYRLDVTEQKALQNFIDSHRLRLVDDDADAASASLRSEPNSPAADRDEEPAPAAGDANRLHAARAALSAIATTVQETELDSKRTAAAVAVASAALMALDFAELLTLAEGINGTMEGLPDPAAFTALPLGEKLIRESRAAGMLICAALYGEAWQAAPCGNLSRAAKSLRRIVADRDWDVRDLDDCGWGFFRDHEKHRSEYRCQLARHIAKAAELRLAPKLAHN